MVPNEDDIYVFRCEEVTVGDIKRAIDAGEDWPDWREYKNRAYSIEC